MSKGWIEVPHPLPPGRDTFVRHLRDVSRSSVVYAELPGAQHAFEIFHSLRTRHVVRGVDRFLALVYSKYLAQREDPGGIPRRAMRSS